MLAPQLPFFTKCQKSLNNLTIKLGADTLLDCLDHNLMSKLAPIGTVRGHSIIGISYGKNPGQKGDGFTLKTIRISFTVPSFMMMQNDFLLSGHKAQVANNVRANYRMLFDCFKFLFGQGTGF